MATHVIKNTTHEFVIKIMNENSYTVALSDAALGGVTPDGLVIRRCWWSISTSGNEHVEINRNSVEVLDIHGSGFMDFSDHGMVLDEESDQSIVVTPTNIGHHYTVILGLGKVIE
jgi:hypothetical protein